jgi:hypothetical protein
MSPRCTDESVPLRRQVSAGHYRVLRGTARTHPASWPCPARTRGAQIKTMNWIGHDQHLTAAAGDKGTTATGWEAADSRAEEESLVAPSSTKISSYLTV